MQNHAPTIYAYDDLEALLQNEAAGGKKSELPGSAGKPVTERPDSRNNCAVTRNENSIQAW